MQNSNLRPSPRAFPRFRWLPAVLLLFATEARAADPLPCPEGTTDVDIALDFNTYTQQGINWNVVDNCGESGRTDGDSGSCDDGSLLWPVDGSDFDTIFPDGIPFAGEDQTEFFININGNLSFGEPIPEYTPTAI